MTFWRGLAVESGVIQALVSLILLAGAIASGSIWIFRQVYEQPIVREVHELKKGVDELKKSHQDWLAKFDQHLMQSNRTLSILETNQKMILQSHELTIKKDRRNE